jgi:hypothetical protein
MERAERAGLYIFLFGVGLNMIAVAGPLAFPAAPIIAWRCVLYAGVIITFLSGVFLVYEYRHLARSARSFLLIGMVVCGFGFAGFAVWYFWPSSVLQREAPLLQTPETIQPREAQKQVSLLWECQTATLPNVVPSGGVNIIETTIDDDGTHPNVDFLRRATRLPI